MAPFAITDKDNAIYLNANTPVGKLKNIYGSKEKKDKEVGVYFRIPAACTVRLLDGTALLLQSRMPIYQLGQESSLPLNMVLK